MLLLSSQTNDYSGTGRLKPLKEKVLNYLCLTM